MSHYQASQTLLFILGCQLGNLPLPYIIAPPKKKLTKRLIEMTEVSCCFLLHKRSATY